MVHRWKLYRILVRSQSHPGTPAPKRERCGGLLALAALGALLPGCALLGARGGSNVAELGQPAPDFELHAVGTDVPIRLSKLRGKPVIVNFFCGCRLCYDVAHAWDRVRDKTRSAQMLAIMHNSETFSPVNVRAFREGTHFEAPILADLRSAVALKYRSVDCPMTWVIDRDGIVRYHNESRTQPAEEIVAGAIRALTKIEAGGK